MNNQGVIGMLKRQSFQPNLLSIFINPFFFIRRGLAKAIRTNSIYLKGNLIDFGCGRKPYRNLINASKYIGVDIEISGHSHVNSEIDVFYDGQTIPFPDESFDSFFCSEVFEHLFNLEQIVVELNRVLKKGGRGLITVPFAWPEHEVPYDFGRYTSFGIQQILQNGGFKIQSIQKIGHWFEAIVQLSAAYVFHLFQSKSNLFNTLFTILLISPINIVGSVLCFIAPKKYELYHNLIVVVEKPNENPTHP